MAERPASLIKGVLRRTPLHPRALGDVNSPRALPLLSVVGYC
jgi:hypothetical protein